MRPVAWVLDLDGVVWLAEEPIPGAAEAVARLRAAGERVLFVTNNSSVLLADQEAKLARMGIPATGDVLTSAQAAASLVGPGERVQVCAGPGVIEALEQRGAELAAAGGAEGAPGGSDEGAVDAVVVGWHRSFDYDALARAATAVRRGARLIATNDDPTYPTPQGPIPGGGAILAAVATAAGVEPIVAGKPYGPMAALVRAAAGGGAPGMVVGDRPSTDGALARAIGWRFGLVLSGVTGEADLPVEPAPDLVAADLAALCTAAGVP